MQLGLIIFRVCSWNPQQGNTKASQERNYGGGLSYLELARTPSLNELSVSCSTEPEENLWHCQVSDIELILDLLLQTV